MDSTAFLVFAIICIALQALLLILALFDPGLPYRIRRRPEGAIDSPEFARLVELMAGARMHGDTRIEVLTNGDRFYPAELEAIGRAVHTVSLEAYIFQKGDIGGKFIRALTERARAGVQVRIVLDAVGSFNTWRSTFRELIEAGGEVHWYMPVRWYNLPRLNRRTHRELLIVDGQVGFVGGAGIADQWWHGRGRNPQWRDTMFRVEGEAVARLQSMFAENWLEASGELLADTRIYCPERPEDGAQAMIMGSSAGTGRSSRARMLFQTLIGCATRSIHISTPYFLPDRGARAELVQAMRERGVEIKVITPGRHADHLLTRGSSRRLYGDLLRAGVEIWEYQPAMIHNKALVVDGVWSVVGSTNFDHRSFNINEEVNLVALDRGLASRLEEDFARDLAASRRVTWEAWKSRSPIERVSEYMGWLIERQQ